MLPRASASKKLRKDILKTAGLSALLPAASGEKLGKTEAAEVHARLRAGARRASRRNVIGIEAVLVIDLPLLGIAQNIIGFLHVFEALFSGLIARVQIRMILPCKFPIRFPDLVRGGPARHIKSFIIIVLRRHKN